MKPRIREVIIVEGRYDKNALSQVVDAVILTTEGFGVFHDKEKPRCPCPAHSSCGGPASGSG